MKFKKKISLILSLTLLASLLSACGSAKSDTPSNAGVAGSVESSPSQEETKNIAFDAEENTIYFAMKAGTIRNAINILADLLGYYKEEGVNVKFVNGSGTEALTAITTGKAGVDVLGTGIVPDLTFIANGSDLVIFEGTAAEGGAVIARKDEVETYKGLQNYAGITAAMVRGESGWVITRAKLIENGVDVDSIHLLEVDSEANVAQAVAKGEADVGFLPTELAKSLNDIGTAVVYEVGELDPQYVCCRQVTSSQKLEEKRDAFIKFSIANLRAWEYYEDENNRDNIVKLLAEFSGQTEQYVSDLLFVNRTVLTLDPNEKGIISYYNSLDSIGYFDGSSADIEDHIDTSVYAEALQTVLERYPDDAFFQDKLELYREYNTALI